MDEYDEGGDDRDIGGEDLEAEPEYDGGDDAEDKMAKLAACGIEVGDTTEASRLDLCGGVDAVDSVLEGVLVAGGDGARHTERGSLTDYIAKFLARNPSTVCWNCCHTPHARLSRPDSPRPLYALPMPLRFSEKARVWQWKGFYCSYGCMKRDAFNKFRQYDRVFQLIQRFAHAVSAVPLTETITMSHPREVLVLFGGVMSISQYRSAVVRETVYLSGNVLGEEETDRLHFALREREAGDKRSAYHNPAVRAVVPRNVPPKPKRPSHELSKKTIFAFRGRGNEAVRSQPAAGGDPLGKYALDKQTKKGATSKRPRSGR